MFFQGLCILFIILYINICSPAVLLSDVSDCSKVEASRDFPPKIWLGTKNLEDECFLEKEKKVRRIVNETRKFLLRCLAPFAITMRSTSGVKENIDQVKNNLQTKWSQDLGIFSANSTVVVEPGEEFDLDVTCLTTCDSGKFFFRAKIYAKQDGENFNKIYTQDVSSQDAGTSYDSKKLVIMPINLGWVFFLGVVIVGLIMTWAHISLWQRGRQWVDIQLCYFGR